MARTTVNKINTIKIRELGPKRIHPPSQCSTSEWPLQLVKLLGPSIKQTDVLKISQEGGHRPSTFMIMSELFWQINGSEIYKFLNIKMCKSWSKATAIGTKVQTLKFRTCEIQKGC